MESKLRVTFYLKCNETKSDGQCPIYGCITIKYSKACFSTKLRMKPALWRGNAGRVAGRSKDALSINNELDEYLASAYRNYDKLSKRFDHVTPTQVKEAVQGMVYPVTRRTCRNCQPHDRTQEYRHHPDIRQSDRYLSGGRYEKAQ